MRVTNLAEPMGRVYSSNVYLIRGDWNTLEDVNTLVDVGNDPAILERLRAVSTGVGKKAIEQVILTHSHFDHAGLLPLIRQRFPSVVVWAYSAFAGADRVLSAGQNLRCGDRVLEVIPVSEHSSDSICLYDAQDGALFVGDTPVVVRSASGSYAEDYLQALERLARQKVTAIYPGHGVAILHGGQTLLEASLANVRQARAEAGQLPCQNSPETRLIPE